MEIVRSLIMLILMNMFKIDLIVWKSNILQLIFPNKTRFKIDLIVWKSQILFFTVLILSQFKIDLIVWKLVNLQDGSQLILSLK